MKGEVVQTTVGSTNKEDPEGILDVCRDGLQREQQVIIFCPTKQQCLQTAIFLHKHLGGDSIEVVLYILV